MSKKTKKIKASYLATLAREVEEVVTGEMAAARVSEVTLYSDGSSSRREIDPELVRSESARRFAVHSRVAEVRHRLNLTQQAFARRTRIPLSTIQKWERNATSPTGAADALIEILSKRPDVIELLAEPEDSKQKASETSRIEAARLREPG